MVSEPPPAATLEKELRNANSRHLLRFTEPETPSVGLSNLHFNKPSGWFWCLPSLRIPSVKQIWAGASFSLSRKQGEVSAFLWITEHWTWVEIRKLPLGLFTLYFYNFTIASWWNKCFCVSCQSCLLIYFKRGDSAIWSQIMVQTPCSCSAMALTDN